MDPPCSFLLQLQNLALWTTFSVKDSSTNGIGTCYNNKNQYFFYHQLFIEARVKFKSRNCISIVYFLSGSTYLKDSLLISAVFMDTKAQLSIQKNFFIVWVVLLILESIFIRVGLIDTIFCKKSIL